MLSSKENAGKEQEEAEEKEEEGEEVMRKGKMRSG